MRDAGNKEVMAKNLRNYMAENNVTARELSRTLKFPYTTVVSWINADNYPRIDKIEAMADYFGIQKSDLIEEKKESPAESERPLDPDTQELYEIWKTCDADDRRTLIEMARLLKRRR